MSALQEKPNSRQILSGLRDFQRATVEYVFDRLYGADPISRFLVADEVGLGKTLVARGVIAKAIDRLWDDVPRIDVVYICSNSAIARQNIARLNVTGLKDFALPSRLTLLPSRIRDLKQNRLNFVSFTPGTSFDLRSSLGTAEERALLYWMLPEEWRKQRYASVTLLAGYVARDRFDARVKTLPRQHINQQIEESFHRKIDRQGVDGPSLKERFGRFTDTLGWKRKFSDEQLDERAQIVGELRAALAASSIQALEPDLIILDEFQRFKHLLGDAGEDVALARDLFDSPQAKVLLLSATPYKMYTLNDEAAGEDHFADFVQTLSFLFRGDSARTEGFRDELRRYRSELCSYGSGSTLGLFESQKRIEDVLKSVMVRTERLAETPDRNGMVKDVADLTELNARDIEQFVALQRISRASGSPDVIEYWKSAPYILNFMDDYDVKRRFEDAVAKSDATLYSAVETAIPHMLSPDEVERYSEIDPGNSRLRSLIQDLEKSGAWDVAWVPPSFPYYDPAGPFAGRSKLTKRLVFSAWQVVPKAIASFLSHEAERRVYARGRNGDASLTRSDREKHRGALRFAMSEGRPAAMTTLGLIYPSLALASSTYDPLEISLVLRGRGSDTTLEAVLDETAARLRPALARIGQGDGPVDERWYWAAPVLLDRAVDADATRRWLGQARLAVNWRPGARSDPESEEERSTDAWHAHVKMFRQVAQEGGLGAQPRDLPDVIALLAVAGFGVASLRSIARITGDPLQLLSVPIRNAAGQMGDAWLSFFNLPEVDASVHSFNAGEPYWRRALEYAAAGGIQALLDEYAHILIDALGVRGKESGEVASAIAEEIGGALRTRTANLGVDYFTLDPENKRVIVNGDARGFRTRFAVRFGARTAEDGASADRDNIVRRAFNSPFWPFVLCSTSVGQEGLDFHQYCHAVVHWNVPTNPVDFEQREGRVHRYKNHAVRKNVASMHGQEIDKDGHPDPWRQMFAFATKRREAGSSDLIPYWIFPHPDGAHIERHVPVLPLSADAERAQRVRRALAVYRLAFGQSRQEDLVSYLTSRLGPEEIDDAATKLRIDLTPPKWTRTQSELLAEEPPAAIPSERSADGGDLDALRETLELFISTKARVRPQLTVAKIEGLLNHYTNVRPTNRAGGIK